MGVMKNTKPLKYDDSLMWDAVAAHGASRASRDELFYSVAGVRDAILFSQPGFWAIPDMHEELAMAQKTAKLISAKFRALIVVGIGGSDLGARALISALAKPGKGMKIHFLGANTDPDEIARVVGEIDWRKTAINIISKSGDTIEPMSTFLILREMLIKKVGLKKHSAHVVATTDHRQGALQEIAQREGYMTLPVPERIGGRFSALTPVGLFPAACAGIDVKGLLMGAGEAREAFASTIGEDNGALVFAALQCDAARRGMRINVLMPYSAGLKDLSFWYRQLWAESLGKRCDRNGKVVHAGMTPIASLGATDQHSQIQLYIDGPADKTVTFIEVGGFGSDMRVPKSYRDIPVVAVMGGHKLSAILHAEREATARALAGSGVPSGTIFLDQLTASALGELMMFFMLSTAVAAEILDVNAYDQPGVEAGKRLMREIL